jgi:hypothetical protein
MTCLLLIVPKDADVGGLENGGMFAPCPISSLGLRCRAKAWRDWLLGAQLELCSLDMGVDKSLH